MASDTDRQILMLLTNMNTQLIQIKRLLEGIKGEGLHVRTQQSNA